MVISMGFKFISLATVLLTTTNLCFAMDGPPSSEKDLDPTATARYFSQMGFPTLTEEEPRGHRPRQATPMPDNTAVEASLESALRLDLFEGVTHGHCFTEKLLDAAYLSGQYPLYSKSLLNILRKMFEDSPENISLCLRNCKSDWSDFFSTIFLEALCHHRKQGLIPQFTLKEIKTLSKEYYFNLSINPEKNEYLNEAIHYAIQGVLNGNKEHVNELVTTLGMLKEPHKQAAYPIFCDLISPLLLQNNDKAKFSFLCVCHFGGFEPIQNHIQNLKASGNTSKELRILEKALLVFIERKQNEGLILKKKEENDRYNHMMTLWPDDPFKALSELYSLADSGCLKAHDTLKEFRGIKNPKNDSPAAFVQKVELLKATHAYQAFQDEFIIHTSNQRFNPTEDALKKNVEDLWRAVCGGNSSAKTYYNKKVKQSEGYKSAQKGENKKFTEALDRLGQACFHDETRKSKPAIPKLASDNVDPWSAAIDQYFKDSPTGLKRLANLYDQEKKFPDHVMALFCQKLSELPDAECQQRVDFLIRESHSSRHRTRQLKNDPCHEKVTAGLLFYLLNNYKQIGFKLNAKILQDIVQKNNYVFDNYKSEDALRQIIWYSMVAAWDGNKDALEGLGDRITGQLDGITAYTTFFTYLFEHFFEKDRKKATMLCINFIMNHTDALHKMDQHAQTLTNHPKQLAHIVHVKHTLAEKLWNEAQTCPCPVRSINMLHMAQHCGSKKAKKYLNEIRQSNGYKASNKTYTREIALRIKDEKGDWNLFECLYEGKSLKQKRALSIAEMESLGNLLYTLAAQGDLKAATYGTALKGKVNKIILDSKNPDERLTIEFCLQEQRRGLLGSQITNIQATTPPDHKEKGGEEKPALQPEKSKKNKRKRKKNPTPSVPENAKTTQKNAEETQNQSQEPMSPGLPVEGATPSAAQPTKEAPKETVSPPPAPAQESEKSKGKREQVTPSPEQEEENPYLEGPRRAAERDAQKTGSSLPLTGNPSGKKAPENAPAPKDQETTKKRDKKTDSEDAQDKKKPSKTLPLGRALQKGIEGIQKGVEGLKQGVEGLKQGAGERALHSYLHQKTFSAGLGSTSHKSLGGPETSRERGVSRGSEDAVSLEEKPRKSRSGSLSEASGETSSEGRKKNRSRRGSVTTKGKRNSLTLKTEELLKGLERAQQIVKNQQVLSQPGLKFFCATLPGYTEKDFFDDLEILEKEGIVTKKSENNKWHVFEILHPENKFGTHTSHEKNGETPFAKGHFKTKAEKFRASLLINYNILSDNK
jgi:hypothetical protein